MASVVFRPLPVMQTTVSLVRADAAVLRSVSCVTPTVTPPAVSVKMPCGFGEQLDGVDDFGIGDVVGPAAALADQLRGVVAVGGIADGQRPRNRVAAFADRSAPAPLLTAVEIGEQPVACAPKNFTGLASTQPSVTSSRNALAILPISEPPAIGTTTLSGKRQPSCSAISNPCGLRAFGVVRAQVDVDESPLEAVGDLGAEAVDLVVVAVDANDARAIDGGVQNFRGLKVGGDEDAGVEALLRGLRGDGVGEVAGRGAADGLEAETPRGHQRRGHHAILEGERREADGVVLEIEILSRPRRAASFGRRPAGCRQRRWAPGTFPAPGGIRSSATC